MALKVEKVVDSVSLGEGPHWDAETQSLYFVDTISHFIHKYVPFTKKHTKASVGKNVSIIIPVKDQKDQFVITLDRELVLIEWDGESDNVTFLKTLYEVDKNTSNVFNDGKCDPSGRLWAGTLGAAAQTKEEEFQDEKGSLFSFQNNKITTQLTKIGVSNGLAFDVDRKKFYYIDSFKGTLDQYDFDITNGTITNGKPIFTLNKVRGFAESVLDGMTIDIQGNIWVAVFNAFKVIKIDPRKPEIVAETIQIPAKQVTSVTFGGPNMDELYVTTGRLPIFGEAPSSPQDGATYKVTGLNAKGLPGVRVVL